MKGYLPVAGKETDAKPEDGGIPEDWSGVGRLFVTRVIEALFSTKTPAAVIILIFGLALYHLGYLFLLKVEDRASAQSPVSGLMEPIVDLISADFWKWVFFACFLVSFLINIALITFGYRRIQRQGTELSDNRNNRMSYRVSSRDIKSLDTYDSEMKSKFGGDDDSKPD